MCYSFVYVSHAVAGFDRTWITFLYAFEIRIAQWFSFFFCLRCVGWCAKVNEGSIKKQNNFINMRIHKNKYVSKIPNAENGILENTLNRQITRKKIIFCDPLYCIWNFETIFILNSSCMIQSFSMYRMHTWSCSSYLHWIMSAYVSVCQTYVCMSTNVDPHRILW